MLTDTKPTRTGASRRNFLLGSAVTAGALVVGASPELGIVKAIAATAKDGPMPNAFVKIAADDSVTVIVKFLEMGQGVTTGMATLVADELDADWSQMRVAFAPADAALYNLTLFGPFQATGRSLAMADSWEQLRKAGAAARAMLIAAAAAGWKVPAGEIRIEKGSIVHARSGRRAGFGAFAAAAAVMPVPQRVEPKAAKDWIYIGKQFPRVDSVAKTTGAALYSLDVKRPGMLTAVVARPPRFGGAVKAFDAAAAKAIAGVVDVVQIPQGVAVLARDTWSALRGRAALKITWDDSGAETRSSDAMLADYRRLASTPGRPAARRGDAAGTLKGAARIVETEFTFPFLAHAPMEPLNGVIELTPGGAEIWAGSQLQTLEQATAAAILGLKPPQVKINTIWAGGSFGRRGTPNADYIAELAMIAKASRGRAPIHLVWTRDDDLKGGRYRPMAVHRVRAGLDARGDLVGWEQRIVTQSFLIGSPFEAALVKHGVDETAVEGSADVAYAIPNFAVDWHHVQSPITTLWWRSVGHTHTAQAVETTVDALARAAGRDPVAFRLAMLKDAPRKAAVLRLAAERGALGATLPAGRGRGIAVHAGFGSFVAMVAEVAVKEGAVKVERIVAAVDCGIAVNPDVIRAQVEGGVAFGLSAALRQQITFKDGVVEQANFDTYEPLRFAEMPKVEVHIVPSSEPPSGIGEPVVPAVAPAITNAIFAATGKRLTSLPLDMAALKG